MLGPVFLPLNEWSHIHPLGATTKGEFLTNLRGDDTKAGQGRTGPILETLVLDIFKKKETRGWKGGQLNGY